MIQIARAILILVAYLLLPFYGLWLLVGAAADRVERKRKQT